MSTPTDQQLALESALRFLESFGSVEEEDAVEIEDLISVADSILEWLTAHRPASDPIPSKLTITPGVPIPRNQE